MYINPVFVGIIGTITVELIVLIGVAIYQNFKR